jgi:hypothetical protein
MQAARSGREECIVIIDTVDLEPVTLRKEDPNWRFALGASPITEGLIVRLQTDDGEVGQGYASAAPHMGAILGTVKAELELFRPILIGKDPTRIESILGELDRAIRGAPQAKAAIDCALYDLQARALGVPLCQLLGGQVRGSVPVLRILAIKTPREMAVQAQKLVATRLLLFEDQAEGEVEEDVGASLPSRGQIGSEVHLTVDANSVLYSQSRHFGVNAYCRIRYRSGRTAGAGRRQTRPEARHRFGPDRRRGGRGGGVSSPRSRACERRDRRCGESCSKARRLRNTLTAARFREAAGVRYRLGATVGSRLLAARRSHLAVRWRCRLCPGASVSSIGCSTIRSRAWVEHGVPQAAARPGSGVRRRESFRLEVVLREARVPNIRRPASTPSSDSVSSPDSSPTDPSA